MMRVVAVLAVLALTTACAEPTVPISGDVRNVGAVTVTMRVRPAEVRVGDAVHLTLRLVNNSGRAETLRFSSGQRYDFWITRDRREVWRWSDDRFFAQAVEIDELEGQSGTTFEESWRADATGTFEVHGAVLAEGYEERMSGELEVG